MPAKSPRKIPEFLVRETIDGIPFYFSGYRKVLSKTKTFEDIMADSGLQSILKNLIGRLLDKFFREEDWDVLIGETGAHLDHRSNLGLDVAVYDRKELTPEKFTARYLDIVPKLVIEIDVKVELPDPKADIFQEFVLRKVRKLFQSGTEKVVWVFTKSKTVIVAEPKKPMQIFDWDDDIEIYKGVNLNVPALLRKRGIDPNVSF